MEEIVAELTFNIPLLLTPLEEALMSASPGPTATATPCVGDELLTVATFVNKQVHCAVAVRSFVVPSE
jgi:hypothetical protein